MPDNAVFYKTFYELSGAVAFSATAPFHILIDGSGLIV